MAIDFSKYQKVNTPVEGSKIDFAKYKKREPGNIAQQVVHGIGSSGWTTARGAFSLAQKALDQTGGRLGNLLSGKGFTPTNASERTKAASGANPFSNAFGRYIEPKTGVERGARIATDIAQFFAPANKVNQATKVLSVVPRIASRVVPDVALTAAQSAGGINRDVATETGVAGITSAVGNALLPGKPIGPISTALRGSASGYVADVATGLTGGRGKEREGENAFIPGFGTALGTGIGILSGVASRKQLRQEALTQAVDDLEQKYDDISQGWVTTRKMQDKSQRLTIAKNRSGTEGRTQSRVLAEAGIVPKIEGTNFATKEQAAKLRSSTKPMREANRKALRQASYGTQRVNLSDLEQEAVRRARSDENIASGNAKALERKIKEEFSTYREEYGDTVDLVRLDDIKNARWDKVGFSLTKEDKIASDVDYLIAKSAQKKIEATAKLAGAEDVAQLNRDIGDILEAGKFLAELNGRSVLYGKMGTHMLRLSGAITGSGLGVPGAISGLIGGDLLASTLRSASVATPTKRLLLRHLQETDPKSFTRTLQWLKEQGLENELRLLLPAPSYMPMPAPKSPIYPMRVVPAQKTSMRDPKTGRFGLAYTSQEYGQSQGSLPSSKIVNTAQTEMPRSNIMSAVKQVEPIMSIQNQSKILRKKPTKL